MLRPNVRQVLIDAFPPGGIHRREYQHEAAAEVLLREGIVMALWSVTPPDCLPTELRWDEALRQVRRELPFRHAPLPVSIADAFWEIDQSVAEYLSGMPTAGMVREYVSEDGLALEAMRVPLS